MYAIYLPDGVVGIKPTSDGTIVRTEMTVVALARLVISQNVFLQVVWPGSLVVTVVTGDGMEDKLVEFSHHPHLQRELLSRLLVADQNNILVVDVICSNLLVLYGIRAPLIDPFLEWKPLLCHKEPMKVENTITHLVFTAYSAISFIFLSSIFPLIGFPKPASTCWTLLSSCVIICL